MRGVAVYQMATLVPTLATSRVVQRLQSVPSEEWFVLWGDGGKARAIRPSRVCRCA